MNQAFQASQVVIVIKMVVFPVLEISLGFGVLRRATNTTAGCASCSPTMLAATGATGPPTTMSQLVPPSVA